MAHVKRLVRLQDHGRVALPAAVRRIHNLKQGDLLTVKDTDTGVLITPRPAEDSMAMDHEPFVLAPPTPVELGRRKAAVADILALRATMPSLAPLTAADLVHLAREESTGYGTEEDA